MKTTTFFAYSLGIVMIIYTGGSHNDYFIGGMFACAFQQYLPDHLRSSRLAVKSSSQPDSESILTTALRSSPASATAAEKEEEESCRPSQYGKRMSESIPFLECPKVLQESALAGNVGFDPLRFATNQEQLLEYREAEIKHSRLAMLAAIGWPTSEMTDRTIASYLNAPSTLDDGDRVPSVLNGGMDRIDPRFWGFCLGMCAAIDLYGVSKSRRGAPDYFPGNIGFDLLGLFPADRQGQENMKLAEIKHGRVAMLGVLGYVVEEYITKMAVVDDTPGFFRPITETVTELLTSTIVV